MLMRIISTYLYFLLSLYFSLVVLLVLLYNPSRTSLCPILTSNIQRRKTVRSSVLPKEWIDGWNNEKMIRPMAVLIKWKTNSGWTITYPSLDNSVAINSSIWLPNSRCCFYHMIMQLIRGREGIERTGDPICDTDLFWKDIAPYL